MSSRGACHTTPAHTHTHTHSSLINKRGKSREQNRERIGFDAVNCISHKTTVPAEAKIH